MDIQIVPCSIDVDEKAWLLILGTRDGNVVASCEVNAWRDSHPVLQSVHVRLDFRGRGLGGRIVKAAIERAREEGKAALALVVNKENAAALRLYRRLGFRSYYNDEKNLWMAIPLNQ